MPAARHHTIIDSPYGPLTLVAEDGILCGLYLPERRHEPPKDSFGDRDDTRFDAAKEQLDAYFAGESREFALELRLLGTPFQRDVWEKLREIPYGGTRSYGELARTLGRPGAARAVGLANGRNPVAIIVPCHRVVGASGGLTGFGGGLELKRRLLDFERGIALFCS